MNIPHFSRCHAFFRICIPVLLWLASTATTWAKQGFAIVIDPRSYAEAREQVQQYADALRQVQGFQVYIVQDIWGTPHGIKAELARLHALPKDAIVGAVLIGDIPVAMIRDAQRLTSAFKMNQNADWRESSVPSDRYYEDFGMQFRFLKKDAEMPYYYYALAPASRQHLKCNIFTGRIRPTDFGGVSRYEKLRRYLQKATAYKWNRTPVKQLLFFTGYGYISESLTARLDEQQNLYEHFPSFKQPGHSLRYMDFRQQRQTKFALMNELQRPELDIALLHHHGAPDIQYLDATESSATAEEAQRMMKAYGRGYLRKQVEKGQEQDSVLAALARRFDVPKSWFADAFAPERLKADSVEAADKDLTLADFAVYGYRPRCKMVVLDACFNGSFHLDSCMAAEYIFNDGGTIACLANSVNVLQDKWADRYLGLMSQGLYAGNLARLSGYLENHCIGDPTFAFESDTPGISVNTLVDETNVKRLRRMLKTDLPADVFSLAMARLHAAGKLSSAELLHVFRHANSALLRLQALTLLAESPDNYLIAAIELGVNDDNEAVERASLNYLGKNGSEELIRVLIAKLLDTNTSPRCSFSIVNTLSLYPKQALLNAFNSLFATRAPFYVQKDKVYARLKGMIEAAADKWNDNIATVLDEQAPLKRRLAAVRTTRNYCPSLSILLLMLCAESTQEEALKVAIIESLGWRYHSVYAPKIVDWITRMLQSPTVSPAVKDELQRTLNALRIESVSR